MLVVTGFPPRLPDLALIEHDAVCPIVFYSHDETGPIYFASPFPCIPRHRNAFPFIRGEFVDTLENTLRLHPDLSVGHRFTYACTVAEGLLHLHQHGIVHRAVTSANISVRCEPVPMHQIGSHANQSAVLTDPGVHLREDLQGEVRVPLGYFASDFATPTKDSDVGGFGVVLAELLTGRPAYEESMDPPQLVDRLLSVYQEDQDAMAVACDAFRTPDEYQGVIIIEELDCRLIAKLFCCITSLIKNRTWSSELVLVFFIGYMHMVGNNIVNAAQDRASAAGVVLPNADDEEAVTATASAEAPSTPIRRPRATAQASVPNSPAAGVDECLSSKSGQTPRWVLIRQPMAGSRQSPPPTATPKTRPE